MTFVLEAVLLFQSTSPVRGTTPNPGEQGVEKIISIHVPREGDDACI